ncbi:MAG: acyl-CoA dehydrogenase [Pseudomonadota bacterium]
MSEELEEWRRWIGRSETKREPIEALRAQAMQRTIEDPNDLLKKGDALPPLWHWLYFWDVARQSDLGPDGHTARGGLIPPITLPIRMWAGSRVAFLRPLKIGAEAEKISTVANVVEKQGRSGRLVFVTLHHRVSDGEGTCIEEEQDIVYRQASSGGASVASEPAPAVVPWRLPVTPDPVLLFRYSALTLNGHRIHYDHKYCTEEEGFPGLIVHGPLLATYMLELVRRYKPGLVARSFDFRAFSTIFDTAPFTVGGKPSPDGASAELWIADQEGHLALHGSVELA